MRIILYSIFSLCIIGCSQPTRAKQFNHQNLGINIDTLKNLTKSEFNVVDVKLLGDTLQIVSTNNLLYYPFGVYSRFSDFYLGYLKNGNISCKIDSIQKVFNIIRLQKKETRIEIIENTETDKVEILSAHIYDSNFEFVNGIKIGMEKSKMLLKFFTLVPPELDKINIIKLESGLEGIWYYCIFNQGTLNEIIIETDYELD